MEPIFTALAGNISALLLARVTGGVTGSAAIGSTAIGSATIDSAATLASGGTGA
ncbi:hypothetical [Yersinia pestis KIM10+]|uniref:Uncharacterized protein n=1 Tax=Yersinia pestis TaxID=632 RepID=Q8CL57_YERPE|nr:hypothetical [Yersinia pestis KIM10+]